MLNLFVCFAFVCLFVLKVPFGFVNAQEEINPSSSNSEVSYSAPNTVSPVDDSMYKQAFLAYNLSLEEYKKAHEEYLLRRSQHIKFKTLTSQQDAYKATLEMLIARNDVIVAYLNVLRERLFIAEGVAYETKNRLDLAINLEKDWYLEHSQVLPSAETLENLVSDSNKASARYRQTRILAYEVFYYVSDGKVEDLRTGLNVVINDLKMVKDRIKAEERPEYQLDSQKIKNLDRFLLESENRMARASESQLKAKQELDRLRVSQDGLGVYNSMIVYLSEAQQFFRQVSSFLKEMIREIKSK